MAMSGIDAACAATERELNRELNLLQRDMRELLEDIEAPKHMAELLEALRPLMAVSKAIAGVMR